jgi:hypothetical protein
VRTRGPRLTPPMLSTLYLSSGRAAVIPHLHQMSTTVQGPSPVLPVFFQNSQNSQGSQESGYDDAIEDWTNDPVFARQQARPLALRIRSHCHPFTCVRMACADHAQL